MHPLGCWSFKQWEGKGVRWYHQRLIQRLPSLQIMSYMVHTHTHTHTDRRLNEN
ncbi:Uncharacterized protein APZ42_019989 [Daphnia magna]|uniref:Uncharacterized protein n=1 Tax=Daphnia magna TaxID=35525 RepID=A0A164XVM1_9CRUS|nr:Uncharacterized protein APZ42_019989 [Daphnia magna]